MDRADEYAYVKDYSPAYAVLSKIVRTSKSKEK
jgi:hypothetical protein